MHSKRYGPFNHILVFNFNVRVHSHDSIRGVSVVRGFHSEILGRVFHIEILRFVIILVIEKRVQETCFSCVTVHDEDILANGGTGFNERVISVEVRCTDSKGFGNDAEGSRCSNFTSVHSGDFTPFHLEIHFS